MVVSLHRCKSSNLETDSDCMDCVITNYSESQDKLISSAESQESDNEMSHNVT